MLRMLVLLTLLWILHLKQIYLIRLIACEEGLVKIQSYKKFFIKITFSLWKIWKYENYRKLEVQTLMS